MKRILSLLLAFLLMLTLISCGRNGVSNIGADDGAASTPPQDTPSQEAEEENISAPQINIAVLSGPTGIGAVGLMEASDAGKTENRYEFTVVGSDNSAIVAGLSSGEFDIAAVATNVAANLYNKTSGGVRICALNTYGVLYILEQGESIRSVQDLAGRTLYATGQGANPEYVLNYILTENGLVPGEDVTVEYMDSESLVAKMASGDADLCMLPVPAVTGVMAQNPQLRIALDLTEEWNAVAEEGVLTMGCVVVRTQFAQENPEAVNTFLTEYAASIELALTDPQHTAQLCEEYAIVPKAAIALKAIPDCNLCCVTGDAVRQAIEPYYSVLFQANPAAIGGAVPDEDFYYIP